MRISLLLVATVLGASLGHACAQEATGRAAITGAGSTFAYPIISRWASGFQRWKAGGGDFPVANSGLEDPPSGPAIDYEPSGSLAGTMRVREAAVDFGASDVPLSSSELAKMGLGQFPLVIGGVVAVVNLGNVAAGDIRFTGPMLADIFLGKIERWNDPAITALNPTLKLPDAKIIVVRRADGSGTTYNFTHYLSRVSQTWKEKVGSDLLVNWPVGIAVKGNGGISAVVKATPNAIGYVEYGHAVQTKLAFALMQNRRGRFVRPEPSAFQAAAASANWTAADDFDQLLVDAPGEAAYPIVVTVFAQMKKGTRSQGTTAALGFFQWSLERGAKEAEQLGYVPLPASLVGEIKKYWASNFKFSS